MILFITIGFQSYLTSHFQGLHELSYYHKDLKDKV